MPHNKSVTNHILHLILTLLTFGFWAIIWILIGTCSGTMKCGGCGQTPQIARAQARRDARKESKRIKSQQERAKEAYFLTKGPPTGQRLKVTGGKHKGKFGTVTENQNPIITLADKRGRTIKVHVSELL